MAGEEVLVGGGGCTDSRTGRLADRSEERGDPSWENRDEAAGQTDHPDVILLWQLTH